METKSGFTSSNEVSNSSSVCCLPFTPNLATPTSLEPPVQHHANVSALRRLSDNLDSVFFSPEFRKYADAKIVGCDGREVGVHRCILGARSVFFKNLFSGNRERGYERFELKKLGRELDIEFHALVLVLAYLYGGKVRPLPKDVCTCADEDCSHVGCRPTVDFMVQVLYASFVFKVDELVSLFQRQLLDILDKVQIDDVLVVLIVANICNKACDKLLARCTETVITSDLDVVTLDKVLPQHIVGQIIGSRMGLGLDNPKTNRFPDKHVKRIYRALQSDDVELVRLLLKEGHTNLDDSFALHYSAAYCDAKITAELLDIGLADVNRKNSRGYTVLHIAAMRKEPKIIVSLLTKGGRPLDHTPDGRKALQIAKRQTKAVDYYQSPKEGKATLKDRLCIELLEQAERRDPLVGEASFSLAIAGEDLRMKMLYLENRVGLARLLFPNEAKVVMHLSQLDGTSELPLADIRSNNVTGTGRSVDLNEAPFKIKEEHLRRLKALTKSVEMERHFFPRCSEILNKIMDADDLSHLAYLGNETLEERSRKRKRYMELQEVLKDAFNEDKEAFDKSVIPSQSSWSPLEEVGLKEGSATRVRGFEALSFFF